MAFEDLFAALARVSRVPPGDEGSAILAAAVREAAALTGAAIVVLRVPDGPSDVLEVRSPEGTAWPSARLIQRWHAEVAHRRRSRTLSPRDLPRRPAVRFGKVFPIFTSTGTVGALGVFTADRTAPSAAQYAMLMLLVEIAVARAEAARIYQHAQATTAAEVHDRIAREIHDGPLQLLSGIMLHLRLAHASADAKLKTSLRDLETEMEQAIRQLRALIRNLRVAHPEASLQARVRNALARLEQTRGLSWSLRWRGREGLLQNHVADEVFQVINEALANVYRHSSAKHVEVASRVRGGEFEITVRDDGVGFDVAEALRADARRLSFGLTNMQERVNALGGTLTVRSQPGRGTRVAISVPLGRLEASKGA
ncbi:MAG: sensor histidine kinase [Armatimonadetes bacterium]|nr:sensor histidine kinase [Armatimonadota bacterium]